MLSMHCGSIIISEVIPIVACRGHPDEAIRGHDGPSAIRVGTRDFVWQLARPTDP